MNINVTVQAYHNEFGHLGLYPVATNDEGWRVAGPVFATICNSRINAHGKEAFLPPYFRLNNFIQWIEDGIQLMNTDQWTSIEPQFGSLAYELVHGDNEPNYETEEIPF